MHWSGPSRNKDENIFSDVYIIPLTVVWCIALHMCRHTVSHRGEVVLSLGSVL